MSKSFLNPKGHVSHSLHRLLMVIALSASCGSLVVPNVGSAQTLERNPAAAIDVKLAQPRKGEVARNIALPASVVANQQVTLYSKASGYLKSISVDKGDKVKKGDSIAEIEAPEL